ncbi:hypothetical protein [Bacillus safensis]|uniref:hypothetical protein n=1 Tax=Bacillus safensis TaxID=561879 RepID=UPI0036EBF0A3
MQIFYFNDDYLYIYEDVIDDLSEIPKNATDVQPVGFYLPKFDPESNEWSESASQEYIDGVQPVYQPSELEIVRQQQAELVFTLMMKGVI